MKDIQKPILVDNIDWREKCREQAELEQLLLSEVEVFPKNNGVVSDKNFVRWINCPICGSDERQQLFLKMGFIYVSCKGCKHVYVHNQLKDEYLEDLYNGSKSGDKALELQKNANHQGYWNLVYEKYFRIVERYKGRNKNILDVGCGAGNFLAFVKHHNHGKAFFLHGLELNKKASAAVKKIVGDKNVYNQQIQDIDFQKSFGQIYLWGVLEHLAEPIIVMKKCHDILDDDGVLFFIIPNINSLAVRILGINTPTLEPRSHIQFYTDDSLQFMYKKTGFQPLENTYELPVIDLMYKYISYSDNFAQEVIDRGEGYYRVAILEKANSRRL